LRFFAGGFLFAFYKRNWIICCLKGFFEIKLSLVLNRKDDNFFWHFAQP